MMLTRLQYITTGFIIALLATLFTVMPSISHANTQACINVANQISDEILQIFETGGTDAEQYFTIRQSWSAWSQSNNPITEGDTEYTYGVIMYASENGWVVTEQALNLVEQTILDEELRQEDGDILPQRFTFPESQLVSWYDIISQNPQWVNALDNDIQDAQNLESSCGILLTVANITDGVPLALTSGSNIENNTETQVEGNTEATTPTGSEVNITEQQGGVGNNGLPNETFIFGDGETEGDTSTAIFNVPMISWEDQLSFRLRTQVNDIQIFGVSIEDLQNGTANINDFNIQNLGNIQFNFFNNINIFDIINGNISLGSANVPGLLVSDIEFFYDFFYHVNAEVNLNGQTYDTIEVRFGSNPDFLDHSIAEYQNVSGTFTIDENIYNINNDNEGELNAFPMFVDRPYYIGIYGTQEYAQGAYRQYTIAVKRLHTYTDRITDVGRVVVNWSPSPYMSVTNTGSVPANTVTFSLAGDVQVQNETREEAYLKFGYDAETFRRIQTYPAPTSQYAAQNFTFQRQVTNLYTDIETYEVGRIEPSKMYYAGLYEGEQLVYFLQVGRTPDIIDSEEEEIEGEVINTEEGSMFGGTSSSPFADLEQDLSTGIVPCDGLNVECDYSQMIQLLRRAMNFVFIMIIPISAIAFAYAGFLLLFKGANPESRKKARDIFIKVFIGIVIVLAAWLIVKTILTSLGVTQTWALIDLGGN